MPTNPMPTCNAGIRIHSVLPKYSSPMIESEVVATTVTVAGANSTISSTGVVFGPSGSTGVLI